MDKLFAKLNELEEAGIIRFDRRGTSLVIFTNGYKHHNHGVVDSIMRKEFKLKYNFDIGVEEFDSICGKTFTAYKNVYTNE